MARQPDLIGSPAAASLHLPAGYVLLTPLTRLYDEVTLLTDQQLAWLVGSLLAIGAAWLVGRALRITCPVRRCVCGLKDAALVLVGIIAWFGAGAIAPRPMARLSVGDTTMVVVDFHSHTDQSHDGRWRWDAEANRRWHAGAGFHAAYVSDHQTMRGWTPLAAANTLAPAPSIVREASLLGAPTPSTVTLLPAIETVIPGAGAHVNLLGVTAEHAEWFTHRRDLDTTRFRRAAASTTGGPLMLLTLPFDPAERVLRTSPVEAIEWSNASPKGRRFALTHRRRLRHLADSLGVALVAASNHHGWGATAAAWTLLPIAGWRTLGPFALDSAIRATIRERPASVSVIERNALPPASTLAGRLATLPTFLWHALRQLQPAERVALIAWTWIAWAASAGIRRRAGPRTLAITGPR